MVGDQRVNHLQYADDLIVLLLYSAKLQYWEPVQITECSIIQKSVVMIKEEEK